MPCEDRGRGLEALLIKEPVAWPSTLWPIRRTCNTIHAAGRDWPKEL